MKKKIIIWTIITILLVSSALATTKPISGKVVGQTGTVNLFVEIEFLGQTEICTTNPIIQTGPDGSFATNLDNLVIKDVPASKCGSRWKAGDKIWYEFDGHQSEIETIESGTGLQRLSELIIAPSTTPPSSGGSGGDGSRETQEITPEVPKISVTLITVKGPATITNYLKLTLLNNIPGDLEIKLILSESVKDQIIKTTTDKISLTNTLNKEYSFMLFEPKPGRYKVQAFVYHQNKLIAVSNIENILIRLEPLELEELPPEPVEKIEIQRTYSPYQVLLLLLFIGLLIYMVYRQIKK